MRWILGTKIMSTCIYPFHEELVVIFEINNHSFGGPIYDSSSEACNEGPKYLEHIEQPSIHSTRSPRNNIIQEKDACGLLQTLYLYSFDFLQSVVACLVLLCVCHLGST